MNDAGFGDDRLVEAGHQLGQALSLLGRGCVRHDESTRSSLICKESQWKDRGEANLPSRVGCHSRGVGGGWARGIQNPCQVHRQRLLHAFRDKSAQQ